MSTGVPETPTAMALHTETATAAVLLEAPNGTSVLRLIHVPSLQQVPHLTYEYARPYDADPALGQLLTAGGSAASTSCGTARSAPTDRPECPAKLSCRSRPVLDDGQGASPKEHNVVTICPQLTQAL